MTTRNEPGSEIHEELARKSLPMEFSRDSVSEDKRKEIWLESPLMVFPGKT